MKNIKLPYGINTIREVVYIDNAKNGIECECICPACKSPLVAKNGGQKREHHFAHLNIVECEHGYQSALHYMAKDLFLEMEYLTFVKNEKLVKYKIDSVELERKVSDIIPDILVTCDGKQFIVEIYVTHSVDDEKKEKIKSLQMSAIEIDLSKFRNETIDKEINLERALQMQYRKFVSIGQSLYAPTVAYSAPPVNSKRNYQSRHYHSYHKRRR